MVLHLSNTLVQRGLKAQLVEWHPAVASRRRFESACRGRCRIPGIEPISPNVYGCCGLWITSATGPISATRSAYYRAPATRSAVRRSRPCRASPASPRCCACAQALEQRDDLRLNRHVKAVVGSSAMITFGWQAASASAMTTRCRMPPENWRGSDQLPRAAGMPTSSSLIARSRAAPSLNQDASEWSLTSCRPTTV